MYRVVVCCAAMDSVIWYDEGGSTRRNTLLTRLVRETREDGDKAFGSPQF